jgi:hypothetical protein
VNVKWQVFGGNTGPFPTVWVIRVVRPVAIVLCRVELDPEPTQESESIANAICLAETSAQKGVLPLGSYV